MKKLSKEKQFNQDLDDILSGKTPPQIQAMPQEYQEMLELASNLADPDFISPNRSREIARQRLLSSCRESVQAGYRKESGLMNLIKRIFEERRPGMVIGTCAIIALLAIGLIFPSDLKAVASNISYNIIKTLKLGPYCSVIQVEDTDSGVKPLSQEQKARLEKEGTLDIETPDGVVTIRKQKESDQPPMNVFSSVAEAQKEMGFTVVSPTYLPAGYAFKEAKAYKGSDQYLNLYFNGSGKDIILMERLMNKDTAYVASTNGPVESVDINGAMGAWEAPHCLTWEKDGVNCTLICKGFSKEEALKIARSFR